MAVISYHCCLITSQLDVLCFRKRPNLDIFSLFSFVYISKRRHKLTLCKRNTIQFFFKNHLVAVISYHCCLITSQLDVLCFRKRPNLDIFPAATSSYHTGSSLMDHRPIVRSPFYRTTRILSFSKGTKFHFYCLLTSCTTSEEKTGNYYRPSSPVPTSVSKSKMFTSVLTIQRQAVLEQRL